MRTREREREGGTEGGRRRVRKGGFGKDGRMDGEKETWRGREGPGGREGERE